jgi:D-glycero-alpha-D-manno-heptose-7-phosphate kinase
MSRQRSVPKMVTTRTPLRISFAGGGTDLPDYYQRHYGAVCSTAINQYIYVTLKRHGDLFGEKYRLNYSETEHTDHLEDIQNSIARECLRLVPIDPPVYVSTVGDLPAFSGLGSSSCFAVGLLNALHTIRGERVSPSHLAEEACHIEIDILQRPMGKQDQYAAAFGGLNYFKFLKDGSVTLEPHRPVNGCLKTLFDYLLIFWTGMGRDSSSVLMEQKNNTEQNLEQLHTLREQAQVMWRVLQKEFDPIEFARVLDAGWRSKRDLATTISNDRIDDWYQRGKSAGALAGKICGAGGGGFMLFVTDPVKQKAVRIALSDLKEVAIESESHGSQVVLVE